MCKIQQKYRSWFVVVILLLPFVFNACQTFRSPIADNPLVEMDSMAYSYPRYVLSHIDSIKRENLSDYNKRYATFIKILAGSKVGETFADVALIDTIVEEFRPQKNKYPQNYMRSLVYQGVIRFKNGQSDNRAYDPIKEALRLSEDADKTEDLNLSDMQTAYYYLGLIQNKNNNVSQAHTYFKQALFIAEILSDSTVLFKTYRDMFWNRMKALDFFTAKTILITMQNFKILSDDMLRDVKNAESAFYNSEKKYRNALTLDYQLMAIDKIKNDKEALLADYFRISDNYKSQNKLDSALYYGELATENIIDSTFYLNYYYYLNVAEIAAKMNNYPKSTQAYSQVYTLMNRAITTQLNSQILELEKKYDLSEEQRTAIHLKSNNMWLQFIIIILAFVFVLITLAYRNVVRLRKENEKSILQENKILEQEKQIIEEREMKMVLEKKNAERKLIEKQFVIPIYRQISQRNLDIKNFLMDLKNHSYIIKNPQMLEKIEAEYKNYIQTTRISETHFLNDELFANLTGIKAGESKLFNESEKMMLAFIATGSDNQQMATLLNTSVESIRVRKSKLKRKMEENGVRIPENLEKEQE